MSCVYKFSSSDTCSHCVCVVFLWIYASTAYDKYCFLLAHLLIKAQTIAMILSSFLVPVTIQFADQTVSNTETESPMQFELVLSGPVDRTVLVEVMTFSNSADGL